MMQLDLQTPEQHRQRYAELKSSARARAEAVSDSHTPPPIAADDILAGHEIPGGWYWYGFLGCGQTLRIVDTSGHSTVSALFWHAADTSERYNAGDTVKLQWSARLGRGRVLFSDMGRVLASIIADTGGGHDTIVGGSTQASNLRRYGEPALRNTRDNFLLAAGKLGLGRKDVGPCFAFFAPVRTDEDGNFAWHGQAATPGRFVDLRAEMDILVALSNCPHPLDPASTYMPKPVQMHIRRARPVPLDDCCRNFSDEAKRGFENTVIFATQSRASNVNL